MKYKSVILFGTASFVEGIEAKRAALDIIMKQYSEGSFLYPDEAIHDMVIIMVDIERISGKQSLT